MKTQVCSIVLLICFIFLSASCLRVKAQTCRPSGKVKGKRAPNGPCDEENDSVCCIEGRFYTTYKCSPPVTNHTKATLTLNSFEKGGDGAVPSKCDNRYHSDDTPIAALSTGWFNLKSRCLNYINIHGNGRTVKAMVVDECDSSMGCDADHNYLPPCPNNLVVASKAVWKGLRVPLNQWGELDIHWSDA